MSTKYFFLVDQFFLKLTWYNIFITLAGNEIFLFAVNLRWCFTIRMCYYRAIGEPKVKYEHIIFCSPTYHSVLLILVFPVVSTQPNLFLSRPKDLFWPSLNDFVFQKFSWPSLALIRIITMHVMRFCINIPIFKNMKVHVIKFKKPYLTIYINILHMEISFSS